MSPDTASLAPMAEDVAHLLKALSHPARLLICCQLQHGEMAVSDIEQQLGIRQPRLSRELAKLRDEGLVDTRRESKVVYYRLVKPSRAHDLLKAICNATLGRVSPVAESRPLQRPNAPGGAGFFPRTLP